MVSIYLFGIYFVPSLNDQGVAGVIFLGVLTLCFLGYNFYLIQRYRKKVRYADILDDLNIIFMDLHIIDRNPDANAEFILQRLYRFCDHLSNCFSKLDGNNIGVSIKFLEIKKNRPLVSTLARDTFSVANERKTGTADKINHYIELNTDFKSIFNKIESDHVATPSFYLENKLPICKEYENTSLPPEWASAPRPSFINNFTRRKSWPLPYRSTLVVPIIPLHANDQNIESLRGFLCIDSGREGRFNPKYDTTLLKGVADGLYNKIDKLHVLIQNQNIHDKRKTQKKNS